MSVDWLLRPARTVVNEMAAGRMSAVELLDASKRRVEQVNPALNALVVDRWVEARAEAEQADAAQRSGHALGPLHGLPISIKEMFDVAGLPTTAGILRRRSNRVTRDAEVVRRLRVAGAIVIGKGNVPQMGMMAETDNPVYGRTNNPWDLERGPGGSSGGEAALVAAGAVPLGLGSDGGGSIRQPAHACGVCGFKPTGGRLPMQGHWLSANWPADWAQPGPLARHVDDLCLAFAALNDPGKGPSAYGGVPLDSNATVAEPLRGLRVGVYEQFDEIPANPAVVRAVRNAATVLRAANIDVVSFEPSRTSEMWDLFMQVFYAEGLRDMKRQMQGSPVDSRVKKFFQLTQLPRLFRRPAAWTAQLVKQPHLAHSLRILRQPVLPADRYCQLLQQIQFARFHFGRRLARERIDVLLGPAGPVPAFPHGEFYANYALIYTSIYNLLGVPAGVVPATCIQADEVVGPTQPRDVVDQAMWRSQRKAAGLPIGVQVIGTWWRDDRVLAIMRVIEEGLRNRPDYPTTPPQTLSGPGERI